MSLPQPDQSLEFTPAKSKGKSCWFLGCAVLVVLLAIAGLGVYIVIQKSPDLIAKIKGSMDGVMAMTEGMKSALTAPEVIAALGSPVTMVQDKTKPHTATTKATGSQIETEQEMLLKGPNGEGKLRIAMTIDSANPLSMKVTKITFAGPDGAETDLSRLIPSPAASALPAPAP
jgi:hypothetical protein